jgi:hypothetical protein
MNIAQATTSGTMIGRDGDKRRRDISFSPDMPDRLAESRKIPAQSVPSIMVGIYHRLNIQHDVPAQKRVADWGRLRFPQGLGLALLLALGACDAVDIVQRSESAVSVRYDGIMNGLGLATEAAQRACAAHGRNAKLRKVYYEGLGAGERFAFFDCI